MDLSVNKPAKDLLKRCFEDWYARQVASELEGRHLESASIEPVDLGLNIHAGFHLGGVGGGGGGGRAFAPPPLPKSHPPLKIRLILLFFV